MTSVFPIHGVVCTHLPLSQLVSVLLFPTASSTVRQEMDIAEAHRQGHIMTHGLPLPAKAQSTSTAQRQRRRQQEIGLGVEIPRKSARLSHMASQDG
jgi:hypothetical protein